MEYLNDTYGGLTMVAITKLIMLGIAVVCAVTLAFIVLEFAEDKVRSKFSKKRNRVHFYVARDMDGRIYLYLGKPERRKSCFITYGVNSNFMADEYNFKNVGLNSDDFKDLKWEDEPLEVFLNIED